MLSFAAGDNISEKKKLYMSEIDFQQTNTHGPHRQLLHKNNEIIVTLFFKPAKQTKK